MQDTPIEINPDEALRNSREDSEQYRRSDAYVTLGKKLWNSGKPGGAEKCYIEALKLREDNLPALRNLAWLLEKTNQLQPAQKTIARGLKLFAGDPLLNLIAAKLERRSGNFQEAIQRLTPLIHRARDKKLKRNIHFELGHIYDMTGNVEKAFCHFVEGNRYAADIAVDFQVDKTISLNEIEKLSAMVENPGFADGFFGPIDKPVETPCFLIGFPRSGTTLLDQILDSHPCLQILEEKPAVFSMKRIIESMPGGYPDAIPHLTREDLQLLRNKYFQTINRCLKRLPGTLLVDKLPLNIVKVPLILKVFPNAKFILALRHPYDVCLSCFMQNFRLNNEMANFFSLEDAALYYSRVMELWQRYVQNLPLQFHMVKLETIIVDFETEVRRLLDFIGVEWDDGVRAFRDNAMKRKRIHSPSYHQVIEPLNSNNIYRARRYSHKMVSVIESLKPFAAYFEYAPAIDANGPSPGQV